MQYYHNNKKLWKFEDSVNMSSFKTFIPLTTEQREFYETYPTASLCEVLNCELLIPHLSSLGDYKALKISEMSELSKITALQKYPQYMRDNLYLGVYDDSEAQRATMRDYFIAMRNEFYRLKGVIESAVDKNKVDEICSGQNFTGL